MGLRFLIVINVKLYHSWETFSSNIRIKCYRQKFITTIINKICVSSLSRTRIWIDFSYSIDSYRFTSYKEQILGFSNGKPSC